jgi:predicted kinase
MKPQLYLMMGYPGAGKTTAAEALAEITGAVHLSSDTMRLEVAPQPTFTPEEHDQLYAKLNQTTEELLGAGTSVIYDANLNRREHRQEKYDICQRTGAEPVLLWVQTDKTLAKERALDEKRSRLVPRDETASEMFERIATIIEPPQDDEHAISVDGTKITTNYLNSLLFNK